MDVSIPIGYMCIYRYISQPIKDTTTASICSTPPHWLSHPSLSGATQAIVTAGSDLYRALRRLSSSTEAAPKDLHEQFRPGTGPAADRPRRCHVPGSREEASARHGGGSGPTPARMTGQNRRDTCAGARRVQAGQGHGRAGMRRSWRCTLAGSWLMWLRVPYLRTRIARVAWRL